MRIFKTSQGRSSLFLAFKAFAKKNKKFIITQAFTCVAVPEAIIAAGYIPLWVDIELDTFSTSEESLKNILKKNQNQIAGILIQHTYGVVPKNYNEMKVLAKQFNIPIIEDRCHCNFLKDYSDQFILKSKSTEAIIYCYSFENAKPITLGRGGILLTNNESNQELNIIKSNYKSFKNQIFFTSVLHLLIAINYILFSSGPFYWPLLRVYRLLAKKNILPSNFRPDLNEMTLNRMGVIQSFIISFLIYLIKVKNNNPRNSLSFKLSSKVSNYFLKRKSKYPLFVSNKKSVISYCKKNFICVREYFNSPIQPLDDSNFDCAYYKINLCKIAEKAAKHVIVFDIKPDISILSKLKSL